MTEAEQTQSPLQSDRGTTTIASTVVSQIAGMSAQEVEGVHMGGGASRSTGSLLQSLTGSDSQTRGVSVEVGSVETAIDLTMGIEYGRNMLGTVGEVRQKITERIHNMTGLRITELNVTISDVIFPENGQTRPALQRAETRTGPDFDTRTTSRREPAAGETGGRTEPGEQTRQESEATPVEPRSRTHTEGESGPVPEEEVRAEGEPVGEDETRRLRTEDDRAEETGGTTETGGEGAGDDRTQEIDRERVAAAEERSRRRRERRRRRGEEG